MTNTEKQIWELVHNWCNEQLCEIPDFNRRVLMDRILALCQPLVVRSLPSDDFLKKLFQNNSANDEDTCKVQCGKCAEAEEFYRNDLWRWV